MEYEIKLTQQEIQIISMGLGELQLKVSVNLLMKLQHEVAKQDAEKATPIADIKKQVAGSYDDGSAAYPDLQRAISGEPN